MTELAGYSFGAQMSDEGRRFSVLNGLENRNQNPEGRYPDYKFLLTDEQLVQRGMLPLSDNDRLRAVCTTLALVCGNDFETHIVAEHRLKRLEHANKHLAETVLTASGRRRRRDLVDRAQAIGSLMDTLAEQNHPVFQILVQINADFHDTLTPKQRNDLSHNLLVVTHWNDLRAIYAEQVAPHQITRRRR